MNTLITSTAVPTRALKLEALSTISASFELFCLASGMERPANKVMRVQKVYGLLSRVGTAAQRLSLRCARCAGG